MAETTPTSLSNENTSKTLELTTLHKETSTLSGALIKRKVKECRNVTSGKTPSEQNEYFNDNPGEAVLQVLDMLENDKIKQYEYKDSSGDIPGKQPTTITLAAGAIEGHNTDGRQANITHIRAINGESVICMVNVPSVTGQVAIPNTEITITRQQLFNTLLISNSQDVIATFPEEQQAAIQEHVNILQNKNSLSEEYATALIETTAEQAGFMTKKQWKQYLEKSLKPEPEPTDPNTKYKADKEDWDKKKEEAENASKSFDLPEPIKPTSEETDKYNKDFQEWTKASEIKNAVLKEFENRCGDQILLEPSTIVDILKSQIDVDEKSAVQKQQQEIKLNIDDLEQNLGKLKEAKRTKKIEVIRIGADGKEVKILENVDGNTIDEEIKTAQISLDFAKQYQSALNTLSEEAGSTNQYLENYFEQLQEGEIDLSTAKEINQLLETGDFDGILNKVEEQILEKMGKTKENLNDEEREKIQEALKLLEKVKKLKGAGKIAAIGMAALLLMMIMQGMGGGGQQG